VLDKGKPVIGTHFHNNPIPIGQGTKG